MASEEETLPGPSAPTKRKRQTRSETFAPRKRAATACQFCRVRKTKCDNKRPVCGFCLSNGARCVYGDEEGSREESTPQERHNELLQRLDGIKTLLAQAKLPKNGPESTGRTESVQDTSRLPDLVDRARAERQNTSRSGPYPHNCESLLKWPCFQQYLSPQDRNIDSFIVESENPMIAPLAQDPSGDRVVSLIDTFIEVFLPIKPVIDDGELRTKALLVSLSGFGWDSDSCLVLMLCAVVDFITADIANIDSQDRKKNTTCLLSTNPYYHAARQRIGLLGDSLIDVQCFYFAHILHLVTLRPLQAYYDIKQASVRLRACLRRTRPLGDQKETLQRLITLVANSEHELAAELEYHEDIAQMHPFGSLSLDDHVRGANARSILVDADMSRVWFETETSYFREKHAMLEEAYDTGPEGWKTGIDRIIHHGKFRRHRLTTERLRLSASENLKDYPPDLLIYTARQFLEFNQLLHRPLLYHAVHVDEWSNRSKDASQLAQDGIWICAEHIRHVSKMSRTADTWLSLRSLFASAVMILAAATRQDRFDLPPQWSALIYSALDTLEKWSTDAADVLAMQNTLRNLLHTIEPAQNSDR